MKCGIDLADAVSTVSPTYAKEIKEFNGRGMEIVLNSRKDDVYGILNGVDYSYWNPKTDPYLPADYTKDNLEGKKICKAELQKCAVLRLTKRHTFSDAFQGWITKKGSI